MTRPETGRAAAPSADPQWSRHKLLGALGLLLILALALLGGVGGWVWLRLHPQAQPTHSAASATSGPAASAGTDRADPAGATVSARRDALAAAPMPTAGPSAAKPAVLSVRDPGTIQLPPSTSTGPVGIPAGFPHASEGALAQLVAIDTDVLTTATLDRARAVIGSWAAPGGPTGGSWSAVKALASFHSAAGLAGGPNPALAIRATAMMGLIKASDGPDWALVCVDLQVDATLAQTARVAVADCQRMAWDADRWVIGPGPEPAPAPSIWPGTDAAIDARYRTLRHG